MDDRKLVVCEHQSKFARGLCYKCYYVDYRRKNRIRRYEQYCEWAKRNPEKIKEYNRAYVLNLTDVQRQKRANAVSVWQQTHPETRKEIARVSQRKRRARKCGQVTHYSLQEWQTLKQQYSFRCVGCWRTEHQLKQQGLHLCSDHIVALAKGGLDHITNIQPLCHCRTKGSKSGCNNKKNSKTIDYVIS